MFLGKQLDKVPSSPQDLGTDAINLDEVKVTGLTQPSTCPYHGPILGLQGSNNILGRGLSPMDRFLSEGPSEQYAVFSRPDTGELSISKECSCNKGKEGIGAGQCKVNSQARAR